MNLTLEGGVSIITVFIQGLLSFFSPCVFPLIPLYISYLAGGMHEIDKNGNIIYSKRKVAIHTLCFVIGISTAFFILGIGFTVIGQFFKGNRIWLSRLSGVIMILFGLYQLGIFGKSQVLEREHRLPFRIDKLTMNPITAWILGFTFSFAWTPCVGPTLSSVLLLAGSSESMMKGIILIGVYVLGFIIPFLMVGLFTGTLLSLFKKYGSVVKYTVRIAAILLILMGIMTLSGKLNGTSDYVASNDTINEEKVTEDPQEEDENEELVVAPDFILIDQFGNEHKLSDYEGKTVFLNFWATWCGPCRSEMPDIQQLYEKYGENKEDVIVLGIANPATDEYPNNQDISKEEITLFLEENGWSYPVVFDESGEIFSKYGITSFPTTFMINKDGKVYGYVTGAISGEMMESIVRQTIESTE